MTMPWVDVTTGVLHEAQIFIGSLGASQYTFVEATASQQMHDWIQSHVRMFEFFPGNFLLV
jgi:transposase